MIIGISGKIGSGKSTFAHLLVEKGFQKFSFADWMKRYCAAIYSTPIGWMYDQDRKEDTSRMWDIDTLANDLRELERMGYSADECRRLITNLKVILGRPYFVSLREMLQYVGTEYLRKLDPNFHVKRTVEHLYTDKNYVCDDLRFPNEADALRGKGASLIRVDRPTHNDTGTHISETALDDYEHWTMYVPNIGSLEDYEAMVKQVCNMLTEAHE